MSDRSQKRKTLTDYKELIQGKPEYTIDQWLLRISGNTWKSVKDGKIYRFVFTPLSGTLYNKLIIEGDEQVIQCDYTIYSEEGVSYLNFRGIDYILSYIDKKEGYQQLGIIHPKEGLLTLTSFE